MKVDGEAGFASSALLRTKRRRKKPPRRQPVCNVLRYKPVGGGPLLSKVFATFGGVGRLDNHAARVILRLSMSPILRFSPRRTASGRRAFTLLEIMIALAILGLLVGLAVTNLDTVFGGAQVSTAKLFVNESIKLPLTSYRIHLGDYPTTAEGLQALITPPAAKADRWHGPYLADGKLPLDPWGDPYVYRYPGTKNKKGYDVFSKGPDKAEGTADDIGNWSEEK
jgi:general secretion pathway protein G